MLASQFSINQLFPSRCRIKHRKDFELALRNSCLKNKWFAVHLVNTANDYARLGMVVSKRVMPKSVSRNFAKRLIRECFRQNLTALPAQDFVIRIRRNLTRNTSIEARSALLDLLLAPNA